MDFFKQLAELSPNLDLTLRMMRKGDKITISILPATVDKIKPLTLTATIEELDGQFFDHIRQPLEVVNGIASNAEEFIKDAQKAAPKAADKKEPKAGKDKPAAKAAPEQPAAAPQDTAATDPPPASAAPDVAFSHQDIKQKLEQTGSLERLASVYAANRDAIDGSEWLTRIYQVRKQELAPPASAVAPPPPPPRPAPPKPAAPQLPLQ